MSMNQNTFYGHKVTRTYLTVSNPTFRHMLNFRYKNRCYNWDYHRCGSVPTFFTPKIDDYTIEYTLMTSFALKTVLDNQFQNHDMVCSKSRNIQTIKNLR